MPLGFERINERQQRPNSLINFIKPLEGLDKATSEEFLSRIAAQCYPVMKKHFISVMALEEYEPNPEFLGRNFNAGEVIQLVLKDRQGRWLSMKFVQMVMMHELAHCKQMNHSRLFWTVRNDYAQQMEGLWHNGYTGEGMWGRGRALARGAFVNSTPPDNTQIPEHLCGGSYRRRGRKRKRNGQSGSDQQEKLTYAERQQRRIARKFGKHGGGESLGDDEMVRGALETIAGGKRSQGKPRVANSKRGRELRAAAALARFEHAKKEPEIKQEDSETESEWEDDVSSAGGRSSIVIRDDRGRDLVKVCGDGEDDEEGAGQEMDELRMLSTATKGNPVTTNPKTKTKTPARGEEGHEDVETEDEGKVNGETGKKYTIPRETINEATAEDEDEEEDETHPPPKPVPRDHVDLLREIDVSNTASLDGACFTTQIVQDGLPTDTASATSVLSCPVCSLEHDRRSLTCIACANVLQTKLVPNCWSCKSDTCKGSKYVNPGDAGRCGLCGGQKPKVQAATEGGVNGGRSAGITRPEVLRWD